MRVAAMVVGILFAIWIFFEALLVNSLFTAGGNEEQAATASGGGLAAILIGLGAILALSIPHVSMVLFVLGGIASLLTAAGGYENHYLYAFIGFMLAVFAFFGRRGQLKERREKVAERQRQEDRDDRMETMMYQQTLIPCPSCGHRNAFNVKFCAECGKAIQAQPADVPMPEPSPARSSGQAFQGYTPTQKVEKRKRFRR